MALMKHLEEAADRLKKSGAQMEEARGKPITAETMHEWLNAVTEYSFALSDLHDINMEAMQEQLDDLAGRRRQTSPTTEV